MINKKQKAEELLKKLNELEEKKKSFNETEDLADATQMIMNEEISAFKETLKTNTTIKALEKITKAMARMKNDLSTKPIMDMVRELQKTTLQDQKASREEIQKKYVEFKQLLANTIESINKDVSATDKKIDPITKSLSAIYKQVEKLQANSELSEKTKEREMNSIGEKVSSVKKDLEKKIDDNYQKGLTKNDQLRVIIAEGFKSFRAEMNSRISEAHYQDRSGGGNMNRQMLVGGFNPLTRFTDVNFVAGTGVTLTTANDLTNKRVNITISAAGGVADTLAAVSAVSTDTAKSLYTMTSTIPVEFRTSGGVSLLYLKEDTNIIGVGTATPTIATGYTNGRGIHINDSTNNLPFLKVTSTNVQNVFGADASAGYIGTASNHTLNFTTNNTTRMGVLLGGQVNVGNTTLINSNYLFQVSNAGVATSPRVFWDSSNSTFGVSRGSLIVGFSDNVGGSSNSGMRLSSDGSGVSSIQGWIDPGPTYYSINLQPTGGNVGIGLGSTTNASDLLHIRKSAGTFISESNAASADGGFAHAFYFSRGTAASKAIVQSGDSLGGFTFWGYDGAAYKPASAVSGFSDGTPGTNDMPGALVFSTTADGASTLTQRWKMSTAGHFLAIADNTYDIGTYSSGITSAPRYINAKSGINVMGYIGVYSAAGAGGFFQSSADGVLTLRNYALNDFGRLTFGGTTSSFPALKRSSAILQARLADDSAYTDLEVLDEAYGAGWNGSVEVPTKNAVYDKIETLGGSEISTSGVSAGPGASTTQTITHGLGKTPQIIRIQSIGFMASNGSAQTIPISFGTYNSTGNRCLYNPANSAEGDPNTSTAFSVRLDYKTTSVTTGVIGNVTSTTFDIVWTNTGGNATNQTSFIWEAQ